MGAGAGSRGGGPIADINVTPLVDVMLVLLIVFMVSAELIDRGALPVTMPTAASASAPPVSPIGVTVTVDGSIAIGERVWPDADQAAAAIVAEQSREPRPVLLTADKDARYQQLVTVLEALSAGGVTELGLAVRVDDGQGGS